MQFQIDENTPLGSVAFECAKTVLKTIMMIVAGILGCVILYFVVPILVEFLNRLCLAFIHLITSKRTTYYPSAGLYFIMLALGSWSVCVRAKLRKRPRVNRAMTAVFIIAELVILFCIIGTGHVLFAQDPTGDLTTYVVMALLVAPLILLFAQLHHTCE